jgi:hypothetical protein
MKSSQKKIQKSYQQAAPINMCRKCFRFTGKIVGMKFPVYTENRIYPVFANCRTKPKICEFTITIMLKCNNPSPILNCCFSQGFFPMPVLRGAAAKYNNN